MAVRPLNTLDSGARHGSCEVKPEVLGRDESLDGKMKKFLSHAHSQRTSPWKVFGIAAVLLTAATSAQAWVIDFDTDQNGNDIVHGQVIDNEYSNQIPGANAGLGVDISGRNNSYYYGHPDIAMAFDSGPLDWDDPDLQAPFTDLSSGATINPGNILVIQENDYGCGDGVCNDPDDEEAGGYFEFKFHDANGDAKAVEITSIDFFDIESSEGYGWVKFYSGSDSSGYTEIGSFYVPVTGNNDCINTWKQVTYNIADVTKIKIKFKGSGGIDNIVGQASGGGGGTGVPEPASLALFAGGLLGFAGIRRRWTQGAQTKES